MPNEAPTAGQNITEREEAKLEQPLSRDDKKDAARRTAPSAAVVFEAIRREAVEELARPAASLFWSGLAAGLSMGFSLIAEALLQAGLPEADWRHLVSKLGYSVGFLIVILGRQQLFTENTVTPVIQVLHKRQLRVVLQALRLWAVVLGANLLGTMMFGFGLHFADIFAPHQEAALHGLAREAVEVSSYNGFLSAIFAGWLIALMVWLLPAARNGRIGVIIIITYIVGIGDFSHIIAGGTKIFYAIAAGYADPLDALFNFFIPVLAGNIIGGVAFVAILNYAQASPHPEHARE